MYEVIHDFADYLDGYRVYRAGDEYPRPGMEADEKRVAELTGSGNKIGQPLIKRKEKPPINQPEEPEEPEAPEEPRPKRSKKKADAD